MSEVDGTPAARSVQATAWREDAMPTLLAGTTGAGKSTTTRYLHHAFDGVSIIFNSDEEPDMGTVVGSLEELQDALETGETRIDVRISEMKSRDREMYRRVVQYLMVVGQNFRGTSGPPVIQFITDEVQEYSPQSSRDDAAITAAKRLRKRRIKPVFITQELPAVSTRLRSVVEWTLWLSPPPEPMWNYLERDTRLPLELLKQLPMYDALVFDKNKQLVGRVRAPEKYAVE